MNFNNISGTYNTKFAVALLCSLAVPCENVELADINLNSTRPENLTAFNFITKGGINGLKVLYSNSSG